MRKTFLSLVIPFSIWCGLHYKFFTGHLSFSGDNTQYFHWAAYYVENIIRGVYPLWNPFHAWGSVDNFDVRVLGELNPIYFLMALGMKLGCSAYWSFLVLVLFYFWLAAIGFYALARRVLAEDSFAWLAYILILFSSLGTSVFNEFVTLLIFVPTVWFYVFLIDFVRAGNFFDRLRSSLGIVFTFMLVESSYIPFVFMLLFVCLFIGFFVAAPQILRQGMRSVLVFIREAPWLAVFYIFALVLASVPSVLWYQEANGNEYVLMADRADPNSTNAVAVGLNDINTQGLTSQISWEELFADFNTGLNYYSYAPILVFVLFLLSLLNRTDRVQMALLTAGILIFVISLANVTPVHQFLYHHVFIFHMFRNYSFFWAFLIPLAVLLGISDLKKFLSRVTVTGQQKRSILIYIFLIHGLFLFYLLKLENVPITSYVTIILSALWFMLRTAGYLPKKWPFILGLGAIAVIQPITVLPYYQRVLGGEQIMEHAILGGEFSYLRPVNNYGAGLNEAHGFHSRFKLRKDESGFAKSGYYGTKGAYVLLTNVTPGDLQEYVKHKFILYDRTVFMDPDHRDWVRISQNLRNLDNEAFIERPEAVGGVEGAAHPQIITGPTDELNVEDFDLNRIAIKTDFTAKKFLVYNDSFHSGWMATVDGRPAVLFRTNVAFKGLWIEPGPHTVKLQFYTAFYHGFFIFLIGLFMLWLSVFFFINFRMKNV